METLKNIITRLGPTGGLFLIGFILIVYIAIGFLYFQQSGKQKELEEQITKLSAVISRPLAPADELHAKCDEISENLTPMTDSEYIEKLVSIAEQSGIDIDEDSRKFLVPSAIYRQTKMGGGTYNLISFQKITLAGDPDSVMAFILDLDSGATLPTMVLKKVIINEKTLQISDEEQARRAEFRDVVAAVDAMMMDNNLLLRIPNPMSADKGIATNLMGDNPGVEVATQGFPDVTTTAAQKGYTGDGAPRNGYVLYRHDIISPEYPDEYDTVSYYPSLTTQYYYTCEADGTVRQWDGPNVATAAEYLGMEESVTELTAVLDVDIYTKPQ